MWRGIDGLQGGLHKHTDRVRVPVNPAMGDRGRVDTGPEWGWGEGGHEHTNPKQPCPRQRVTGQ